MVKAIVAGVIFTLVCVMNACSAPKSETGSANLGSLSDGASVMGKMSLEVIDSSRNTVYSDATNGSSLVLKAGQSYTVRLSIANPQPGATYSLQGTQTNTAAGTTYTQALNLGDNVFSVPVGGQGDYSWKIMANAPNLSPLTQFYLTEVQCANATFDGAGLDASKISVSAAGTNLYNLSASGVTAGAVNGTAPFTCAWDPTGTGIQDTVFAPCDSVVSNIYINYVQSRKVGLLVKDACFVTKNISRTVTLPSSEPAMPGNVFISGVLSNAMGSVQSDSRVSGVNYLATNTPNNVAVQPKYSNSVFQIYSSYNYGRPSSVAFGIGISLSGITDSLNNQTGAGTIDASNAKIDSVVYSTDQAGDQAPAVSLAFNAKNPASGTSCQLSNQQAKAILVMGQPCSSGQTTTNKYKITVEVWGHYSCTLATSGGSVKIDGNFDGYTDLPDNCTGGGQGGGGDVPINL